MVTLAKNELGKKILIDTVTLRKGASNDFVLLPFVFSDSREKKSGFKIHKYCENL